MYDGSQCWATFFLVACWYFTWEWTNFVVRPEYIGSHETQQWHDYHLLSRVTLFLLEQCLWNCKDNKTCIIMPRGGATAYGSSFVCLSLRLLHQFCGACWKVRVETCNTSKTRHYLTFEYVKVSWSFVLELWREFAYLECWLAIWTSLKTKLPTIAAHTW